MSRGTAPSSYKALFAEISKRKQTKAGLVIGLPQDMKDMVAVGFRSLDCKSLCFWAILIW